MEGASITIEIDRKIPEEKKIVIRVTKKGKDGSRTLSGEMTYADAVEAAQKLLNAATGND